MDLCKYSFLNVKNIKYLTGFLSVFLTSDYYETTLKKYYFGMYYNFII